MCICDVFIHIVCSEDWSGMEELLTGGDGGPGDGSVPYQLLHWSLQELLQCTSMVSCNSSTGCRGFGEC